MRPNASQVRNYSSRFQSLLLFEPRITVCFVSSLIDRRGFLPPDEAIPAAAASEMELPPFTPKSDANMVWWKRLRSLPGPECPHVAVWLLAPPTLCVPLRQPPDLQLQSFD